MPSFWKVITRAEAQRLYADLPVLGTERMGLRKVLGRVLAEDVFSGVDVPHFPRSAMDGYAVAAEDTYGATEGTPIPIRLAGAVEMGKETKLVLLRGEAAAVSTGGMIPAGADAVVMIEQTVSRDHEMVLIKRAVAPGEHIASIGEDIRKGGRLLDKGRRLRAQDIGALAAVGASEVSVRRQPRIGILSTGNEIVPVEVPPQPGQVRGTNLFTLAALAEKYGGLPLDFGIIRDDEGPLRAKVEEAVASCDIVAISGGSSVGTHDMTRRVIQSLQSDGLLAHGVAMRPGKPTILARIADTPVVGLPGQPVSAAIVFGVLVRPIMDQLLDSRAEPGESAAITARLSQNISSASGREDYLPVALRREQEWWADPVRGKSGSLSTLVRADGLVRIALECEGLEQGTWVEVHPF